MNRKKRALTLAGALVMSMAFLPQQQPQTRREPQFENAHVRAWKSIILPNQPLNLHRHDFGRTIVALRGGTLDVIDGSGKTTKQVTWETGSRLARCGSAGEQHGDMNRAPRRSK